VIKLDIINEVVNKTGITKTKAELAVETVFESMKKSLAKGDRIELRGFGVFNVRPRKTGIGRGGFDSSRKSRPFQAGEGIAVDRLNGRLSALGSSKRSSCNSSLGFSFTRKIRRARTPVAPLLDVTPFPVRRSINPAFVAYN